MQTMGKWILRRIRGTLEMLLLVPSADSAERTFEYVCSDCQESGAKSGIPRIPFSQLKIEKKPVAAGSYKTVFRAKCQVGDHQTNRDSLRHYPAARMMSVISFNVAAVHNSAPAAHRE
jgi:hypothetical protein